MDVSHPEAVGPVTDANERVSCKAFLIGARDRNARKFEEQERVRRAVFNTRHVHAAIRPKQSKMSGAEKVAVRGVEVRRTLRKVGGCVRAVVFLGPLRRDRIGSRRASEDFGRVRPHLFVRFVAASRITRTVPIAVGVSAVARVSSLREIRLRIESGRLNIRKNKGRPSHHAVINAARFATFARTGKGRRAIGRVKERATRRKTLVRVMIILHGKSKVFQVVCALHSPRRLARRLHRRKKKTDQNANNGDHDEEFDKGKALGSGRKTSFHGKLRMEKGLRSSMRLWKNARLTPRAI